MDMTSKKKLHNGVMMPVLGFGVYKASDKEAEQSVRWALETGYRLIDTAKAYENEKGVGRAIKDGGVKREDIFLTTKLWNQDMRDGRQKEAFDQSLDDLGLEYVDLYLIHWPVPDFAESWNILEQIYRSGKAKAIGVCNFQMHHLERLAQTQEIAPMVNQVESHPLLNQEELRAYCRQRNIICEAWSPLGGEGARILEEETVRGIAAKHGRTEAQVVLRWDLQRDVVPLPKSVHRDRIESNADLFDFMLDEDDMAAINAMNQDKRVGPDPDNFDF